MRIPIIRRLLDPYSPMADDRPFLARAQMQEADGLEVTLSVLDAGESRKFFGVSMARRGVQPVWLKVVNRSDVPVRVSLVSIDPNYFSAYEAAAVNHYSSGKRLLSVGLLAWLFLPFLLLLPLKLIGAWRGNRKMDAFFQSKGFHLRPIHPGERSEGFVFTNLDIGNKVVHVRLMGPAASKDFVFNIAVPGLDLDHVRREFLGLGAPHEAVECDIPELRKRLASMPRATANLRGTREGDPVNLVIAGEFSTLLCAFGARWDETEIITLASCWKTFRAFLTGWDYRYSPVSPLYLFGRCQDFALQRVRKSINERLHLRLWATPLRFQGVPVWVGQVSRDIGVRFTWRTWNLTTHRIDPDVDEARDYVVEDLLQAGRVEIAGYADGAETCEPSSPRRNLTGDPYYTDGKRVAILVSTTKTQPKYMVWA